MTATKNPVVFTQVGEAIGIRTLRLWFRGVLTQCVLTPTAPPNSPFDPVVGLFGGAVGRSALGAVYKGRKEARAWMGGGHVRHREGEEVRAPQ